LPYVSSNYKDNAAAPVGSWTCAPTSHIEPSTVLPRATHGSDLCGQCVSYVKKVCPALPNTGSWKKGVAVKNNNDITLGTVIATFDQHGHYRGHAAIYNGQNSIGIQVYDQYVTPPSPKPVGERTLRWNAHGNSNNGDNFYVVE